MSAATLLDVDELNRLGINFVVGALRGFVRSGIPITVEQWNQAVEWASAEPSRLKTSDSPLSAPDSPTVPTQGNYPRGAR